MSLSDAVSALEQPWLAQAGMLCFLAAFAAILARLFRKGHRAADRAAAALPLSDGPLSPDPRAHNKGGDHARPA